MHRWKLRQFYSIYIHLRQSLTSELGRHKKNFSREFISNISVSKHVLPSVFSSLFIMKVVQNENKSENQKIIKEADNLYVDAEYEKLYSFLYMQQTSNDPEILWRTARAIFEKTRSAKDDKERLAYLEEALELVDKALEINEQCWAAHKWKAILLDYVWRYKSTKERIIHSFEVKKHMERAIELNPEDGTNYYILGEWCYTFADMPWYQRKVAAAIFASPPTSSYEEALECFETAEKVKPLFYSMNLLMIAKCYLKLNDKEKAVTFLKITVDYPIKTPDDKKAHEEAAQLLKNM